MTRTTEPVAPPPTRPKRTPAPSVEPTQPVPAPASTEVAHPVTQADPVEALGRALGAEAATGPQRSSYAAFMGIGRPVDPETDLTAGPNRLPRYVIAAVLLIHASTGRSKQSIVAEAITGRTPINPLVLDETFRELYGYDRPPVR